MRKLLLGIVAAGSIGAAVPAVAGSFTGTGQFVGLVSPQISALLAEFPGGGPALSAAIARAVEANSGLAADAVYAASGASPSQKGATGAGLADAVSYFAKCGTCGQSEALVRTAIGFADAGTRVGFVQTSMPALARVSPDDREEPPYCKHVVSRSRKFGNCKNDD